MTPTTSKLETRVGLFLLGGLLVLAGLIVMFGRVGEAWRSTYNITVTFPNASGLLKGSTVYYAGAPVGRVTDPPQVIDEGRAVEVHLKIFSENKIRSDSRFVIGTSGLLGDRFVDIQTPAREEDQVATASPYLKNGDRVEGRRTPGIADLTEGSKPLIDKANAIAEELHEFVHRINVDLFDEKTTRDTKEAIAHLRSVLRRVDELVGKANSGKGAIGRLLNDPQVAEDLSAFVSNLREHGVLFYSDSAAKREDAARDRRR